MKCRVQCCVYCSPMGASMRNLTPKSLYPPAEYKESRALQAKNNPQVAEPIQCHGGWTAFEPRLGSLNMAMTKSKTHVAAHLRRLCLEVCDAHVLHSRFLEPANLRHPRRLQSSSQKLFLLDCCPAALVTMLPNHTPRRAVAGEHLPPRLVRRRPTFCVRPRQVVLGGMSNRGLLRLARFRVVSLRSANEQQPPPQPTTNQRTQVAGGKKREHEQSELSHET